jgi:hypothetical protein
MKQGILSNSWLGVIVKCMWKANKLATRNTEGWPTNLKQGIQSNSWLAVLGDGKLKDNKLETRNTERQLVRCDL